MKPGVVATSLAVLLSGWCGVVLAEDSPSPETERSDAEHKGNPEPGGCPVRCAQFQACIEHRCVPMCRPSCRRGTYCSASGECESLPQPKTPLLTEADRQRLSGAESADATVFVFVDLGGIIGFGARLGLETGKRNTAVFRAVLSNTGIMSHAAYVENEQQRFDWGFGASVGYRHYEKAAGNMRGFYFGGGLDYGVVRLQRRGTLDIAQLQHSAAPYGEFGYRWVFGSFAVGFGPTLAVRYPVASTIVGADSDSCGSELSCEEVRGRRFEGMMNIELGWFH